MLDIKVKIGMLTACESIRWTTTFTQELKQKSEADQ